MRIKRIYIDTKLISFIILFMIISIITINSSMLYLPSYLGNLALKQGLWYLSGFLFIIIAYLIPSNNYKYSLFFYLFNILLLTILLVIGTPINGSKCWLVIPTIGSIQPSEFMKISLILTTSKIVSKWTKKKKNTFKSELLLLLKVFIVFIIPAILTFLEPDTGAILIYFIIILSILIVSPIRKRWFIFLILFFTIFIGVFLYIYSYQQELFINLFGTNLFYRIDRLLDWKKGTGMQLENSLAAIGSAGIKGHGYMNTPIYFPESGTDFIFAVYASNFGLVGSLIFLSIIILFDIYLLQLAKKTNRIIEKYIIIGTVGMLIYQQIQNIGMTLGILPITGITLPFISYGGSSLLSYLLIISIILKISNNNNKNIN